MNAEMQYWSDTRNLEIHIKADSPTEAAALKLLIGRSVHIDEGTTPEDELHLIFEPKESTDAK